MRITFFRTTYALAALAAGMVLASSWPTSAQQRLSDRATVQQETLVDQETEGQLEGEVVLRGPIHEAYAEPVGYDPQPGRIIDAQPPEPIEEVPPPVKPEDDGAIWIPGYWEYNEENNDFMWISGVWRVPPPDRRWVPGYWTEARNGYQRISGMWVAEQMEELSYLPYPPDSLERGPTSPPPSPQHYWVSGSWVFQNDRYVWQPGYWAPYAEGWVWNPSYYNWTPSGVVYCDGYWDYPLARRGTMFAPVYFRGPVRRALTFTPRVALRSAALLANLFINPNAGRYYYGNYYGLNSYSSPYAYHLHQGYDPIYAYNNAYYGNLGVDYGQRIQYWNSFFIDNPSYRPPITLAEQLQYQDQFSSNDVVQFATLGLTLNELLNNRQLAGNYRVLQPAQQRVYAQAANQFLTLVDQRIQVEASGNSQVEVNGGRANTDQDGNAQAQANAQAAPRLKLPKVDRPQVAQADSNQEPRAKVPARNPGQVKVDPQATTDAQSPDREKARAAAEAELPAPPTDATSNDPDRVVTRKPVADDAANPNERPDGQKAATRADDRKMDDRNPRARDPNKSVPANPKVLGPERTPGSDNQPGRVTELPGEEPRTVLPTNSDRSEQPVPRREPMGDADAPNAQNESPGAQNERNDEKGNEKDEKGKDKNEKSDKERGEKGKGRNRANDTLGQEGSPRRAPGAGTNPQAFPANNPIVTDNPVGGGVAAPGNIDTNITNPAGANGGVNADVDANGNAGANLRDGVNAGAAANGNANANGNATTDSDGNRGRGDFVAPGRLPSPDGKDRTPPNDNPRGVINNNSGENGAATQPGGTRSGFVAPGRIPSRTGVDPTGRIPQTGDNRTTTPNDTGDSRSTRDRTGERRTTEDQPILGRDEGGVLRGENGQIGVLNTDQDGTRNAPGRNPQDDNNNATGNQRQDTTKAQTSRTRRPGNTSDPGNRRNEYPNRGGAANQEDGPNTNSRRIDDVSPERARELPDDDLSPARVGATPDDDLPPPSRFENGVGNNLGAPTTGTPGNTTAPRQGGAAYRGEYPGRGAPPAANGGQSLSPGTSANGGNELPNTTGDNRESQDRSRRGRSGANRTPVNQPPASPRTIQGVPGAGQNQNPSPVRVDSSGRIGVLNNGSGANAGGAVNTPAPSRPQPTVAPPQRPQTQGNGQGNGNARARDQSSAPPAARSAPPQQQPKAAKPERSSNAKPPKGDGNKPERNRDKD